MLSPGKDALGQATYERHRPEQTLLYQLIDKHCPALVGELEEWPKRRPYWLMRSFPMCHCDSGSSVFHSLCDSFSPPTLIRPLDRPDSGLERVAKANGFSLHAGVSCEGHQRGKRERLCRYIARPAVATCGWRILTFSMISDSCQLLHSGTNITLRRHERWLFPAFPPAHHRRQTNQARWRPLYHHQAIHPTVISQCIEEAKVSSALFTLRGQTARPKGSIQGGHQSHR